MAPLAALGTGLAGACVSLTLGPEAVPPGATSGEMGSQGAEAKGAAFKL